MKEIEFEFKRKVGFGVKRPEYHIDKKQGTVSGTGSSGPPGNYNNSTGCLVPFILMVSGGGAFIGWLVTIV